MVPPTTTRKLLRQALLRRVDSPAHPIVSATTGLGTTTTLLDSVLAPGAQAEDYLGAWVYMASQESTDTTDVVTEGAAFAAGDTGLTVGTGTLFTVGDFIKIDDEILEVTVIVANLLTVTRASMDTTDVAHANGTTIYFVGPQVGEKACVTNVDFSGTTSTLTLAPAFAAVTRSGDKYEVHRKFHPSILHQALDDVLDELEHPIVLPLTLAVGGDMEGVLTTDFTAGGTATLAADTTYVLHGRQSLKVTAVADSDYAYPAVVYLPGGTQVIIATDCYITPGDAAKLILYDETNGAEIETAQSAASGWVHFEFVTSLPATCEAVTVRLVAQSAGDVVYFDNAILLPVRQRQVPYPSSLEFSDELLLVNYFERGRGLSASTDEFAYALNEKPLAFFCHGTLERDETAVVPYRVQLAKDRITRPLWIEGRVDYGELSSSATGTEATNDALTTQAPKELVLALAHAKLVEGMVWEALEAGNADKVAVLEVKAQGLRDEAQAEFRGFARNRGIIRGANR